MRDADQFEDDDFDVDLDVGDREERVVKVHTFDRFDNTFAELRYVLSHIGVEGTWARLPDGRRTFTTDAGAILDWNPSTKALAFDGPEEAAMDLANVMFEIVMQIALFGNRS